MSVPLPARRSHRFSPILWILVCVASPAVAQRPAAATDSVATLVDQARQAYHEGSDASLRHAIELCRAALTLAHAARDRPTEGAILRDIGTVEERVGELDSALATYGAALAIWRDLGDRESEGATLNAIGNIHHARGESDSALADGRAALAIARAMGDRQGEAVRLHNIAKLHDDAGQPDSALADFRAALAIAHAVGDRQGEGIILSNIGLVHEHLGELDSALVDDRAALAIRRDVGDRQGEGSTLNAIGLVHADLAQPDSALADYRAALAVRRAVGDRQGEGTTLNNIGLVHAERHETDSALADDRAGLALAREVGDRRTEGTLLHNMAWAHDGMGELDSALAEYRAALTIRREVGDHPGEGLTLKNIGVVHRERGESDSALVDLREALAIARAVGDRPAEGTALWEIGYIYHRALPVPALAAAVAYYDSAAAATAAVASHAGGDVNRLSFGERGVAVFDLWALAWLGRPAELGPLPSTLAALAALERGRAQALLELIRGASPDARPGDDLIADGKRLAGGVRASGAAGLAYLVTRDTLLVWLVLPSGAVELTRRAISEDSLAAEVGRLRMGLGAEAPDSGPAEAPVAAARGVAAVAARSRPAVFAAAARALAEELLPSDLEQRLGAKAELVIVPQGPLTLVPFAALPADSGATPLGIRYALRYAPSFATLAEAEARPGVARTGAARVAALQTALVVGNPTMPTVTTSAGRSIRLGSLPGAEAEARNISVLLGVRPLLGPEATEVAVRQRLNAAALVHLATHGWAFASESRARDSFVALAPGAGEDGVFSVGELLDDRSLRLSADLVVLSACETGLGDLKEAEGTVGLQRAFLARGARSVLVSLWSVSDQATAELMRAFYTHWLEDRDRPDKAEALRRAEEVVRRVPGLAAPEFWAAFQLVGAR